MEYIVVEALKTAYPDHTITGEEARNNQIHEGAEYEWIIDPGNPAAVNQPVVTQSYLQISQNRALMVPILIAGVAAAERAVDRHVRVWYV